MPANDVTLRDIDIKIERTEQLLTEAQKWTDLLPTLRNNLDVLRRAKFLLEQDEIIPEPSAYTHVPFGSESSPPVRQAEIKQAIVNSQRVGSISSLIFAALAEASEPLTLNQIADSVRAKGRNDISQKSVSGVIAQHLNKKIVRRVARGTYALTPNEDGVTMNGT